MISCFRKGFRCCPLGIGAALSLVLGVLVVLGCTRGTGKDGKGEGPKTKDGSSEKGNRPGKDWPMFGGTPQRNMVNAVEKNIPADWKVEGGPKNIKWSVK